MKGAWGKWGENMHRNGGKAVPELLCKPAVSGKMAHPQQRQRWCWQAMHMIVHEAAAAAPAARAQPRAAGPRCIRLPPAWLPAPESSRQSARSASRCPPRAPGCATCGSPAAASCPRTVQGCGVEWVWVGWRGLGGWVVLGRTHSRSKPVKHSQAAAREQHVQGQKQVQAYSAMHRLQVRRLQPAFTPPYTHATFAHLGSEVESLAAIDVNHGVVLRVQHNEGKVHLFQALRQGRGRRGRQEVTTQESVTQGRDVQGAESGAEVSVCRHKCRGSSYGQALGCIGEEEQAAVARRGSQAGWCALCSAF